MNYEEVKNKYLKDTLEGFDPKRRSQQIDTIGEEKRPLPEKNAKAILNYLCEDENPSEAVKELSEFHLFGRTRFLTGAAVGTAGYALGRRLLRKKKEIPSAECRDTKKIVKKKKKSLNASQMIDARAEGKSVDEVWGALATAGKFAGRKALSVIKYPVAKPGRAGVTTGLAYMAGRDKKKKKRVPFSGRNI